MVSGTSRMRKTTKKRNRKTERNHLICQMRQQGATYKAIAERFGISICRVRQILEGNNEKDKGDSALYDAK